MATPIPVSGSRETFATVATGRHPSTVAIMRHFAWSHLPLGLQQVSAPFGNLAIDLIDQLPDSDELVVCLRHLRDAKDCAVRAMLDKVNP